ncbi:UNVERIFIED_CONTAM: hypothetical protein FKN15_037861 [Acipenser sinensis]
MGKDHRKNDKTVWAAVADQSADQTVGVTSATDFSRTNHHYTIAASAPSTPASAVDLPIVSLVSVPHFSIVVPESVPYGLKTGAWRVVEDTIAASAPSTPASAVDLPIVSLVSVPHGLGNTGVLGEGAERAEWRGDLRRKENENKW